MKHLRVWPERASSEGTKTGAGGQKTVVRGRPGLRTSEHDLFRNSSFFLARRECFAYAVSWKFLSGTFRTNLSQVRLETYLVGLAMDSLKRQAPWNQRLDFLWHREMRFRISTCGVEWAGNSLQAHVWEISWSNDSCGMSYLAWHYFFCRANIILFSTEFGSLTEVKQLRTEGPSLKSWQHPRNDGSFPNIPRLEIQNWNPVANALKRAHNSIIGRSSIGQKHVWLMFLTWSYTTWVFARREGCFCKVGGNIRVSAFTYVGNSHWQLWKDPLAWLFWATTKGFRLECTKAKCGK